MLINVCGDVVKECSQTSIPEEITTGEKKKNTLEKLSKGNKKEEMVLVVWKIRGKNL